MLKGDNMFFCISFIEEKPILFGLGQNLEKQEFYSHQRNLRNIKKKNVKLYKILMCK